MNLYIYSYNNYYNRQVKKAGDTLEDYSEFLHYGPVQGVYGFTPGDGINTIQIIGSAVQMYDGKGDYLIAQSQQTGEIDSRWFIINVDRTRNGQWKLTLRRDLMVDYYDTIINSPMFIEKATLGADDPLVFNNEQITVNQIKQSDTLLKDKSGCPWIVGYYAKNTRLEGTVPINITNDIPHITLPGSIEEWEFYSCSSVNPAITPFIGPATSGEYRFLAGYLSLSGNVEYKIAYGVGIFNGSVRNPSGDLGVTQSCSSLDRVSNDTVSNAFVSYGMNNLDYKAYAGIQTQAKMVELLSYDGKTIKDTTTGKYYNASVKIKNVTKVIPISAGSLYNAFVEILRPIFSSFNPNNKSFNMSITYPEITIVLEDVVNASIKYNITDMKLVTTDAPWNIFAIPYGEVSVYNMTNELMLSTTKDAAIATAMTMQANHPGEIYDIQLLPYCPIQELITDTGKLTVSAETQYSLIGKEDNSEIVGIIFNVPLSNFSFDLTGYQKNRGQLSIERKFNNECEKWRLTAPNYSNYFDFSVEKNNGITTFNVDCNYKPYTPYIHINPNFDGLYGYDDNSPRGLVCGGDYSLSQIIDQWQQYQIQNKNFQGIFDRQIQNMELKNEIGRTQDIVGAIAGTATGITSGALTGSLVSPGIGTAVGAVAGGLASGAAGIADVLLNEQLRNEAMDYTKDMFGYQLGNIQALPNTISKVSAFNANNKIFPILEYYTCTDREKEAFVNKVAWNGMTVMAIGKISDYIGNSWNYNGIQDKGYIKGKLIRFELPIEHEENLHAEDFHVINAISGELNQGVYIK